MAHVILQMTEDVRRDIWAHLMPEKFLAEEVAFVYARLEQEAEAAIFKCIEWTPILPEGFAHRSDLHLELSDETKAWAIKRAHDLQVSLIEFHSHAGAWPARFSPSDIYGFREFVPHVWWRLKGRPYAAVVVANSGFDGFAWMTDPHRPQRLDGIMIGGQLLRPTGLSSFKNELYYE